MYNFNNYVPPPNSLQFWGKYLHRTRPILCANYTATSYPHFSHDKLGKNSPLIVG